MDENDVLDASAIDNLDDYELTGEVSESDSSPQVNQSDDASDYEDSEQDDYDESEQDADDAFTEEVLRLKGISDPDRIKFEDESGAIVERSWNDLSTNEKLSVLTLDEDANTDLEPDEINFINMLRKNNLTPEQYVQALQSNIIQNVQDNQPMSFQVDNLADDELFALDLIEKLGEDNVTDEELQDAIEQAKLNPELYDKQVNALREHYKNLENQQVYEAQQMQAAQQEQNYRDFSENVLNQIEGIGSIAGYEVDLDVDDKNDLANYILTRDNTGLTDFYKDLQNPQALTTAAFWMLKGPEIMDSLQQQIQEAYRRGYAVGSRGNYSRPQVVVTPRNNTTSSQTDDAEAAFGDDESYLYT